MPDPRLIPIFPQNAKERLKDPSPFAPHDSISVDALGALIARYSGARTRVSVGHRMNLSQGLSAGGNRMVASKIKRRNGPRAMTNLRARFVNWYVTGANVEVGNTADLTVTSSVEYPAGVFHQVKLGGATSFSVSRLVDYAETDPLGVVIPANADWWWHTWADAGNTFNYPVATAQGRAAIDGYESGASVTDKTMTGGESGGASNTYGPAIITGEVLGSAPCVLLVGNSRAVGNNDRTSATGDAFGNAGSFERLLAPAGFNIINFGIPSVQASQIVTAGTFKRRMALLNGITITSILNEHGINDITAGRTAAQLLADQATINAMLGSICDRIVMATLSPKSAGSWSDLAGQSIADATKEAYRVSYNTTVRAGGVSGQTGILDPALIAETSLDSGFWNFVGGPWTDDGTHEIPVGAAAIAAGLNTQSFV